MQIHFKIRGKPAPCLSNRINNPYVCFTYIRKKPFPCSCLLTGQLPVVLFGQDRSPNSFLCLHMVLRIILFRHFSPGLVSDFPPFVSDRCLSCGVDFLSLCFSECHNVPWVTEYLFNRTISQLGNARSHLSRRTAGGLVFSIFPLAFVVL